MEKVWYNCLLPIYILLLLNLQKCVAADNRTTLHIAVLIPFAHIDHSCTKHAIDMAVEDVNNKKGFITNFVKKEEFRLQVHYMETGKSDGNAIEALYRLYSNGPTKISTLGPPFADQNEFCAEYSTAQANFHITYSEPNEPLEPYLVLFYQSTPSIIARFLAARDILSHFNWTQVGILYDYSDTKYRKNADNLRIMLQKKDSTNKTVKVLSAQGIWSTPSHYSVSAELNELQTQGARIIFAMVSVNGARKIFCEAHKSEMVKPKVTWFLFEKLPKDWATDKYNHGSSDITKREIDCTPEELMNAARGYISIVKQGIRIDGETTIGNQTKESYEKRLRNSAQHDKCDESVAYAYDSVWVLANLYSVYAQRALDLTKYWYHNFPFALVLFRFLEMVKFEGITGPLNYKKHDEIGTSFSRRGQISIWSHPDDKTDIFVGTHTTNMNKLSLTSNINNILFDLGIVPNDKASYVLTFANFAKTLLVTMWAIAILGIILAVSFLAITLYYVSTEHIKVDSPVINGVIVLGCVTCYLSVLAYGMDTRFVSASFIPSTCWAFLILLSIGFTLTFGSLFAKAWQLYKQYMTPEVNVTNGSADQLKSIPDGFLYLIIGSFVVIDVIIITTWYAVSPFEYVIKNITTTENLFADTIYIEQIVGCSCKHESEFIIGMYCYKGLLLIFGIFLVWQTRNAKIKVENDSKQIGMAIYNVVAVSLIGVICVSVLANTTRYEASYAIIAVCICICNTTTLMLFFLPKLRQIMMFDGSAGSDEKTAEAVQKPSGKYSISYMRKKTKTKKEKQSASTVTLNTQVSAETQTLSQITSPSSQHDILPQPQFETLKDEKEINGSVPVETGNESPDERLTTLSSYMIPPEYQPKQDENGYKIEINENSEQFTSGIYLGKRLSVETNESTT